MADARKRVEIDVRTTGAQKAEAELKSIGQSGDAGLKAIVGGAQAADGALRLLGPVITRVAAGAVSLASVGLALRQMVRAGDELAGSLTRLGSATGNVTTATEVYDRLYAASLRTGASVADSISAFTRFSVAARDIGATNDQVLRLVAGIQGFARLAGSSTAEVNAATLQLGQALASGTLQGDELRSVLEAMPQLAQALAAELGMSVGQLRKAGAEGRLTAEQVFPALLRASEGVQRQLAGLPLTLEQGTGILTAAMDRFLGQLDQAIGGSRRLAQGLAAAGQAIDATRQALLGPGSQDERFAANAARIRDLQARRAALDDAALNPQPLLGQREAERERLARIRALDDEIARLQLEQDDIERDRTARRLNEQAEADRRAREQRRTAGEAAYNQLREQIDREFKLRKEFAERSALLDRARAGGAISEQQFIADSIRLQTQLQDEIDKLREAAGRATRETREFDPFRGFREAAQRLEVETRTPLEAYSARLRELEALLTLGGLSQETFNRAVDRATRDFVRTAESAEQAGIGIEALDRAFDRLNETLAGTGRETADYLAKAALGIEQVKFSFEQLVQKLASGILSRLIQDEITGPLSRAALQLARAGLTGLFGGGPSIMGGSNAQAAANLSAAGPSGLFIPPLHSGGIAGIDRPALRRVPAALFADAPRLHRGGLIGPGEVPAILRRGEGVFTEAQMAALAPAAGRVTVNVIDQRSSAAAPAEVSERADGQGGRVIDVLIRDIVSRGLADGSFDRTLAGAFGIRRRGAG
ncbi:MAG: tape measure protein [Burkholderiaceae bacterium]|nr:tape measure protein [Burkholderiaceae bacterium]